ncbi:MAG: YraN family protein [Pseudomonadota bacterium]
MTTKKIQSYQFGIIAEFIAIIFLRLKGYKILKRRYKTFVGEIDIIASKGRAIVAVEVKARKKNVVKNGFLIDEVLGENQKRRIKRAIMAFMAANFKKYYNYSIRCDLIVISPYKIPLHLLGFWE